MRHKDKPNKSILLIFITLLLVPYAYSQPPFQKDPFKRIAFLSITSHSKNLSVDHIQFLTNELRHIFLKHKPINIQLISKENIMVLMPKDQLDNCIDECEIEIGRKLSAHYIITGDIFLVDSIYRLNLRLHNTLNEQIISSISLHGKTIDDILLQTHKDISRIMTFETLKHPCKKLIDTQATIKQKLTQPLYGWGVGYPGRKGKVTHCDSNGFILIFEDGTKWKGSEGDLDF